MLLLPPSSRKAHEDLNVYPRVVAGPGCLLLELLLSDSLRWGSLPQGTLPCSFFLPEVCKCCVGLPEPLLLPPYLPAPLQGHNRLFH